MNICRITSAFPPPWHGLAPGPFALSFAQFQNGMDLTVITRDSTGANEVDISLPFSVERISSKFDVEFSFKAFNKFSVLNRYHNFNLIHGHGFSSIGVLFARKFTTYHIPVITTIHCVRHMQRRSQKGALETKIVNIMSNNKIPSRHYLLWEALQEKFVVKNSDRICAVSTGVKKELVDIYPIPHERIYVVGNGVDTSQFKPLNQLAFEKIKCIKLLWVGRFSGFKGEIDLITACDILRKKQVNFHLKMIGNGDGHLQAAQYVRDLHLNNNIEIIPYISYKKISEHYQKAHVFILPSLYEGMPKVVLEAMACGCPIIVSDIPGCKELVKEGRNGFLVPIMRPDLLVKAILALHKNPNLCISMEKESRKIVEDEYTWDAVARRVEQCYQSILRK